MDKNAVWTVGGRRGADFGEDTALAHGCGQGRFGFHADGWCAEREFGLSVPLRAGGSVFSSRLASALNHVTRLALCADGRGCILTFMASVSMGQNLSVLSFDHVISWNSFQSIATISVFDAYVQ
jgi:hypothetical protein